MLKILTVLIDTLRSAAGKYLTDEAVWKMVKKAYQIRYTAFVSVVSVQFLSSLFRLYYLKPPTPNLSFITVLVGNHITEDGAHYFRLSQNAKHPT